MAFVKSSTGASRWQLAWWQQALFLLAFALVADVAGFSGWLTGTAARVLSPLQRGWVAALGGVFTAGENIVKLPKSAQRIQDLESRLAEASASLAELETLRRENEELRFLLGNTDRSSQRTVIAAPVVAFARPAISAGSQAGIQPGAVVLSRNTLLGLIDTVSAYESQVVLLTEKSAPPVLAKTESGVEGLVVGDGKKLLFTQVPKDALVQVGERIVTLGQPQIEQNLPIGKIISVIDEPVASVQTAVIEQYASFYETPLVEVH